MRHTIKTICYLSTVCLLGLMACTDDVDVDAVYITAAEKTPVTTFSVKQQGDAMGLTISSALKVEEDVSTELAIDNSLVETYNSMHGDNYQSLPEGTFALSQTTLTIKKGGYRSESTSLQVSKLENLKKGMNYLLPVRMTSKNKRYPQLPGSDVLYVVVNRTLLMNVPRLNGSNCFKVTFKDNDVSRLQNLDAFTLEARVCLWEMPKYYGGNLMGILGFPENSNDEKSAWLFVDGTPDRVGGEGNVPVFMFGLKQWDVYAGRLGFSIAKNEWYHIAGVFANNKLSLYIDGILFAEADYAKKVSFTKNFYIGAAPGVQNGFYLKGSVNECRFWTRALTPQELKNPLHQCFVETNSKGLEGYWKLDDGTDECKDYTGHGHTAHKDGYGEITWQKEVPCPFH